MTGYSQVDTLGLWYKLVNFWVRKGLVSPKCETESATERGLSDHFLLFLETGARSRLLHPPLLHLFRGAPARLRRLAK